MYECNIAATLVALRAEKGATQEDVAQSLQVSNKTVSKWETGVSMPDLPMLIALARYYGVTTDALLGLSEERYADTQQEVRAAFRGLDRRESVCKAFETVRSIIPAVFDTMSQYEDNVYDDEQVFPTDISRYYRSHIATHEFFDFVASSEDVNIAVMMLRNKSNFAWMKDAERQAQIVRLFAYLADAQTISVLHFIHTEVCSESFTADYIAAHTGVAQARVAEILDELCAVGECRHVTAHLIEGEVRVYECMGDGMLLSLITLAYESMCGKRLYAFNYNGRCKMIKEGSV